MGYFIKGLYCNITYFKNNPYVVFENKEIAEKYYYKLRSYGMDIHIMDNKLNFNNIYIVNLNNMDPNDSNWYPSDNVISIFHTKKIVYEPNLDANSLNINRLDTNNF